MGADVSPATRPELAPAALHALLREVFGYNQFRGPQADIIGHVSQGGDALVLMPTGGGKSLCYQIPAIARQRAGLGAAKLVVAKHLAQQGVQGGRRQLRPCGRAYICSHGNPSWRQPFTLER